MDDQDTYFSNENATFGDRVAAAREAQGLTQEDFAKKLGVKLKTVRGWEDDVDEPRANRLSMMSGMMNVSMRWLLTGEGDGLDAPVGEVEVPGDVKDILLDIRRTKAEFARLADHLGRLEKRLGKLLRTPE
ncbi:transcriptional regulator, XRE family [Litoreibacter ascidiaceicola]|uniref:Transcriptional regulator, XRE family n=1 Tax=Litoreibacter ascidiaceicola TaxID=1486859 RepID=A0A1M4UU27_9RHOB|nr:helix-turn-helix domain-containing protein [Litoreibacter ascidiaceicola]SHE60185.1 transcriptional regulator, XRE family [Litoreibacter ascidiaceicola]